MTRDIAYSIALHLALVFAALAGAAVGGPSTNQYDDVIRVNLAAPPLDIPTPPQSTPPPAEPEPTPDPPTPEPPAIEETVIPEEPTESAEPEPEPEIEPEIVEEDPPPPVEQPARPPDDAPTDTPDSGPDELPTEADSEIDVGRGSPFAGATVDNASFNYPFWFDLAFDKIARNFRNTVSTDARLVCVVSFEVLQSGRVVNLTVEHSSGIPRYDDACLAAIERSSPFRELPREFLDEVIRLTIPFANR